MSDKIVEWINLGPHRFLEDAPTAVIVVHDSGTIAWANKAAVTLFGYSRGEFVGQPIDMLVPPDIKAAHSGNLAGWIQHPRARQMGSGLNIRGLNKNGAVLALDIQLTPIETDTGVMAMAWISERKE